MNTIPLIKDELIGLKVIITSCTDPTWVRKSGIIIDETKNTFLIESKGMVKCIAKDIATFTFERNGTNSTVSGSDLRYRSEERVKKAR